MILRIAVSAAIIARPDLYAAHDKWIKDYIHEEEALMHRFSQMELV
jgi:hypothetical protein